MSNSIVAGHVEQVTRADGSQAGYFLVRFYVVKDDKPVIRSEWTDSEGNKRPNYEYLTTLHLPISTLKKVIKGEQTRCLMYKRLQ